MADSAVKVSIKKDSTLASLVSRLQQRRAEATQAPLPSARLFRAAWMAAKTMRTGNAVQRNTVRVSAPCALITARCWAIVRWKMAAGHAPQSLTRTRVLREPRWGALAAQAALLPARLTTAEVEQTLTAMLFLISQTTASN